MWKISGNHLAQISIPGNPLRRPVSLPPDADPFSGTPANSLAYLVSLVEMI